MKLRALHLENVRRFAGQRARLDGIGNGLTVVSEANEFGKSTFFDGLHALFFERYASTGRAVKSLQPHSQGAVRVAAEVETSEGVFRIEKSWLKQKKASVREVESGRLIASDGEAEAWIAGLIGTERDGPPALLWVRQGATDLEPEGSGAAQKAERERLTETRRGLLSSIAGEIDAMTGGRRMDRVLSRVSEDLSNLVTATGRPSGQWKAAEDEVRSLDEQYGVLDAQCRTLVQSLERRRQIDEELRRLWAPETRAKLETDRAAARRSAQEAAAHAERIEQAKQTLRIRTLEAISAETELDAQASAETRWRHAASEEATAAAALDSAGAAIDAAETVVAEIRSRHEQAVAALTLMRQQQEAALGLEAARRAADRAAELSERLARAETRRAEAETARAIVDASPVDALRLAQVERSAAERERAETARQAGQARLRLSYSGAARAYLDGRELAGDTDIPFGPRVELDLPGIGRLSLRNHAGAARYLNAALEAASSAYAEALAACGVETLDAARDAARARAEIERRYASSRDMLEALAPDGLEALRSEAARTQAMADTRLEDFDVVDPEEIGRRIARAVEDEARISADLMQAERRHAAAQQAAAGANSALSAARRARQDAEAECGPDSGREARRTAAARAVMLATEARRVADEALATLIATAPDLRTAEAELQRAESAAEAAGNRRSALAESRAGLSATIEAHADSGIEERRDEIAGRREAAMTRAARLAADAAGLQRLRRALEDSRSAARDAYFGPVQEELAPLLDILHADAALAWGSDTLLPRSLRRGSLEEEISTLSEGTREQIAVLTRLAFARLLARQGRSLPIILDDALVYSDDTRIQRMFVALTRVALDQQILVFSCRQLAFEGLGGARPEITVSEIA